MVLRIARARIAHRMGEAPHRLDILREYLGPESTTVRTSSSTPWKSGVNASTAVPGLRRLMARMAAA